MRRNAHWKTAVNGEELRPRPGNPDAVFTEALDVGGTQKSEPETPRPTFPHGGCDAPETDTLPPTTPSSRKQSRNLPSEQVSPGNAQSPLLVHPRNVSIAQN